MDVGWPQSQISEALEEGHCVLLGELQVRLAQLEELTASPESVECQRGVDPGAEDHPQADRHVLHEVVQCLEHVAGLNAMQIVEDQRDGPVEVGQVGRQRLHGRHGLVVVGVHHHVERLDADAGLVALERGNEVCPEVDGVGVQRVDREPGNSPIVLGGEPLTEERGLARARRTRQEGQAGALLSEGRAQIGPWDMGGR